MDQIGDTTGSSYFGSCAKLWTILFAMIQSKDLSLSLLSSFAWDCVFSSFRFMASSFRVCLRLRFSSFKASFCSRASSFSSILVARLRSFSVNGGSLSSDGLLEAVDDVVVDEDDVVVVERPVEEVAELRC